MDAKIKQMLELVRQFVKDTVAPLLARVDALEKRQPERGEKGEQGSNGLDGAKGADGLPGRDGVDGKDGQPGRDGAPGADGNPGRDGADGADGEAGARGEKGDQGLPGKDGERGPAGNDGKDGAAGEPGKDGAHGRDGERGADGKAGADGLNGKDGRDGADGKSVELKDLESWLEASFSKWALAVERRVYDAAEKAIAAMPRPVDGKDGLSIQDFKLVGRKLFCKTADGETVLDLPIPVYHGVFDPEITYAVHDMVTFGGSVWVAVKQEGIRGKPGTVDAWKLAVKKGQDGRKA